MSDIALPIGGLPELPFGERLLSDERLVKLASRGSARAFATLYERHHQAIYRYCRSIVRNDHDAQDALQSAMTRAYAALCARERDLAVRPWLFRIAHNEAISILRRRGREEELVDVHESLDSGVEQAVAERERLSTLLADLQALPERQRAALLMRELSGLSIQEIAGALSVSTGAAKQTLFEARSSLHELAEGRAMECETVRRAISERAGRVLRGRRLRAHLRDCAGCRDFHALIQTRGADLRALAPPLPATAASALLARLLAHGGAGHAGAAASVSGASFGSHAAASLVAKGLAGVAILAAATAGTVHLAAQHHDRLTRNAGAQPAASAHAGAVPGASATGRGGGASFGSSISAAPLSGEGASAGTAGGSAVNGARETPLATPQTPDSTLPANGRSRAAGNNTAAGQRHSVARRPTGANGHPAGKEGRAGPRPASNHSSHRSSKRRRPASSRSSHGSHRQRAPKKPAAKPRTPAGKAPQSKGGGGANHTQQEHQIRAGEALTGTANEAHRSTVQSVH